MRFPIETFIFNFLLLLVFPNIITIVIRCLFLLLLLLFVLSHVFILPSTLYQIKYTYIYIRNRLLFYRWIPRLMPFFCKRCLCAAVISTSSSTTRAGRSSVGPPFMSRKVVILSLSLSLLLSVSYCFCS